MKVSFHSVRVTQIYLFDIKTSRERRAFTGLYYILSLIETLNFQFYSIILTPDVE